LRIFAFALLVLALAAPPLFAQGGPPLITDDPDTPGPRHWEINLSFFRQSRRGQRLSEQPRLDLNYGAGRRIQLKLEAPWLVRREEGAETVSGPGNAVAGVKWRFWGEEGRLISWSVYPQYEFNTSHSSVRKELVEDGHALLLPTELTLDVHPIELSLEVGRNLVSGGADTWIYGVAFEASVGRRLELVGEVHGEKATGSPTELILNGGARGKLSRQVTLMVAVGHAVHGADKPSLLVYAGLQFNLPDAFDFSAPAPGARASRPGRSP
jgi:hypothetical protein